MTDRIALLYATFPDAGAARAAARALLEARLIACANIFAPHTALYRWEGEVAEEGEVAVLFKTTRAQARAAAARIADLHPYDTPALMILDAEAAPAFAAWVAGEAR
jgi:periplasmic divalent cation tolerance protein